MRLGSLVFAALMATHLISPTPAAACDPEGTRMRISDAADALRRVSRASDLDDAQTFARRASSALLDVETSLRRCDCTFASVEFSSAATAARRASMEDQPAEFEYQISRAIRSFNDGLAAINARRC